MTGREKRGRRDRREGKAGKTREKDSNFALTKKNSPCFLADLN